MKLQIPVWETIGFIWEKTKGAKSTIWAAVAVTVLIAIGLNILLSVVNSLIPSLFPLFTVIAQITLGVIYAGMIYIGIQRAKDMPISFDLMFYPFKDFMWLKLVGLYLLQGIIYLIIISIAFLAHYLQTHFIFPFRDLIAFLLHALTAILLIFFATRMVLGLAFTLDQGSFPWTAIQQSFRSTADNIWRLIAIFFIQFVIVVISMIPLFIGLIWTIPFAIICYGMVYKRLLPNA